MIANLPPQGAPTAALSVQVVQAGEIKGYQQTWQALLEQSRADQLFMSWDWHELWRHHYPLQPGEEFLLYVARVGDRPVALLPVVQGLVRRRLGLRFVSSQVAGYRMMEARGAFSEWLDVISLPQYESETRRAMVRQMIERGSTEIVVGLSPAGADWEQAAREVGRLYVRPSVPSASYHADLSAGFQAYLASLGGSSRRTLYNLRRRLQEHGPVRLDMVAPQDALQALSELDALHVSRWRQPVFSDGSLPLHRDLIERWSSHGRIVLSRLMVGSRCVSCLYDIRIGTRQYNIQMGFDSQFDAKISLGILHLGYAMEDAAAKGVHTYDLLCGRGMRSDYKRNISNASTPLQTVHALRRGGVSLLYRLHDATSEFGLRRVRRLPA